MILRPATLADEKFLLNLRNDPVVCAMSWMRKPVAPKTHHEWLCKALRENVSQRVWVAHAWYHDVGTARLYRDGKDVEFSIALCPEYRGKGLSRDLVGLMLPEAEKLGKVGVAKINADNLPSLLAFLKNGFTPHSMQIVGPRRWVVLTRKLR